MIRVEIELSSTDTPASAVLTVTNWIVATLAEEMSVSVTVHSINVSEDA